MSPYAQCSLVLMRHASALPPHTGSDLERPLAPEGQEQARTSARRLREWGVVPEMILCSTALRTRQTCLWVAEELGDRAPTATLEPELYRAEPQDVLDLLRAVPPSVQTLLVIGHMPTLFEVLLLITSPQSDQSSCERAAFGFPPAALAVFSLSSPWAALDEQSALLAHFETP